MRILPFISDLSGVGHWRIGLPATTLMQQDDAIEVIPLDAFPGVVKDNQIVSLDEWVLDVDVAIIQRPMAPLHVQLARTLKQAGVAVVVELDDLMHKLPKGHAATVKPVHLAALEQCIKEADLLTVSTVPLAEFYGKGKPTIVVPNFLPEWYCNLGVVPEERLLGWFGSVAAHPDIRARAVGSHLEANSWRFRVIGRPEGIAELFGLIHPPESVPWMDLHRYQDEVAKFSIGVCPLGNNPFSRAKSALKMMEFAGLSVPVVASPVYPYRELHEEYGIGMLADQNWSAVNRLMRDRGLRSEESLRNREIVREHLTIESNCYRWVDAWEQAVKSRQARTQCV